MKYKIEIGDETKIGNDEVSQLKEKYDGQIKEIVTRIVSNEQQNANEIKEIESVLKKEIIQTNNDTRHELRALRGIIFTNSKKLCQKIP